ncbi:MAG TPA: TfuA-related McrA-glycine thioamidation protein, partial [Methanocella sp.]|nr:TfuA-related McrA-glycine thioamidation protein [Methanocella sp.]
MIVVYTGPSLSAEKAQAILDAGYADHAVNFDFRSPIARGDLKRIPRNTRAVGIIDGVFFSDTAVAHKEIIAVMQKGVKVFGSSSMGALRAAELAEFGMVGVGRVYECYRSGRIAADDEVAVTFNPVTGEQISEPLVNVRYQLKAAEAAGVLAAKERHAMIELAGKIFYPDRTYEYIVARSADACILPQEKADRLLAFVKDKPLNLKAEDAVLLLNRLKEMTV